MHAFRAELAKLRRPMLLWLGLGVAVLAMFVGSMSQEPVSGMVKTNNAMMVESKLHPLTPEELGLTTDGQEYQEALAQDERDLRDWAAELERSARISAMTQQPLGALGLAAGFCGSMIGVLFMLLAAGVHVGGEWTGRTIKEVLPRDGRMWRFVVLKAASLWVAGLWLLLCSWVGLVLLGVVGQRIWPLGDAPATREVLSWAGPLIGRVIIMLGVLAVLGAFLGVIVRSPIGTFLGGMLLTAAAVFATRSDSLAKLSPAGWGGTWMRFTRIQFVYDHPLWPEADPNGLGSPLIALIALVTLSVVLLGVATFTMKRRDVVG